MEVPDDCAGEARRCMAWLKATSCSSAGKILSVSSPDGNLPWNLAWHVRLMSMTEAVDYTDIED